MKITPVSACTTAIGRGVYKRRGEEGRLSLTDNLHTNLGEKQQLVVGNEPPGTIRFHLTKLEEATCTGAAGERAFHGKGKAAKGTEKGYTVTFTIKEQAGGYHFESGLMKGTELVELSGGPLRPLGPLGKGFQEIF